LAFNEKVSSNEQIRFWSGSLPLHYKYTHGVAGEKFLRHIKDDGKILGTKCNKCKSVFLPPRMYCRDCFEQLTEWVEVKNPGRVHTFTIVKVPSAEGHLLYEPAKVGLVKFEGFEGGLIHFLDPKAEIGSKVKPVFKPKNERVGSIMDIERFSLV
jgi:uncharacterized OB-fold protein